MFISKQNLQANLNQVVLAQLQRSMILSQRYKIITNKINLKTKAEEISRLFINNATYAGNEDKRKAYSMQAIEHRIDNKNVFSFAVHDTHEDKLVAFLRVYINPGIGAYASDLVTIAERRHQGLAVFLMKEALLTLEKEQLNTIFLIAGDDNEAAYYDKQLGFQSVCLQNEPLDLGNDKVFMFGLFPQQKLLKDFLEDFPMPAPPEEHKLPISTSISSLKNSEKNSESNQEEKQSEENAETEMKLRS